jgi:hypothetical protein
MANLGLTIGLFSQKLANGALARLVSPLLVDYDFQASRGRFFL